VAYIKEKQVAIEAALKAAAFCMDVQNELIATDTLEKGDKSPVTIADFGAQALVCQQLRTVFPNDIIVGEEDASSLKRPENLPLLEKITAFTQRFVPEANNERVCEWIDLGNGEVNKERFWTLDPIDGTKGFLRREQYAIAIALIENGDPKVGVLACPMLPVDYDDPKRGVGCLFVAVRGEGALMASLNSHRLQLKPIHLVDGRDPKRLRCAESIEHGDHEFQKKVIKEAGLHADSLKLDSQAKYGVVARGDAALYLRLPSPTQPDYREKIWDHAAGVLLVEEAGGKASDMLGQRLQFATDQTMKNNQGVVVSTPVYHRAVIDALRYFLA
jgi:3'(2'), 5'-bisphosphate nucleotidase